MPITNRGNQAYTRGADKSLARPGRKQARKHVRDARDFKNIETRAVIIFFFLQGKAPKEIRTILTETLGCFLPGRAKDISAPRYIRVVHERSVVCTAVYQAGYRVRYPIAVLPKIFCSLSPF